MDDWLYDVRLREQPAKGPAAVGLGDDLPGPGHLAESLRARLDAAAAQLGVQEYGRVSPEMERLSTDYAMRVLCQLGSAPRPGDRITLEGFAEQSGSQAASTAYSAAWSPCCRKTACCRLSPTGGRSGVR